LLASVRPVSTPKAVQEAVAIPVASEPKPVTGAAK
jgi:hypothetical protein